jgi:hypothetical protein
MRAPPNPIRSARTTAIDDAAEREDQRQAECDQKVISPDQEAVENLLEYEDELHAATLRE